MGHFTPLGSTGLTRAIAPCPKFNELEFNLGDI